MKVKNESKKSNSLNLNDITKYITSAFGSKNEKDSQNNEELNTNGINIRRNIPGFFTPYETFRGFALGLAAPIVAPLIFSLIAAAAVVIAAVGALSTIVSLLITGGSAFVGLFNKNANECLESAATFSMVSAMITAVASLAKIASILMAAVLLPLSLALLVTRSAATLTSFISDCCFNSCNQSDLDEESSVEMTDMISPVTK